ncbi:DEAD/DEAH box helicase [Oesophagostomum dentatum]|uniref:Probable ATP-dependent RNA helicase DDX46 n=1 Tax=Oesophagostomum dentatum TaxID=61180 RepID=A0A0B1TG51_OESDE|nr:DEAD/DEAH box helicase [Oesophagostomum dentatum]
MKDKNEAGSELERIMEERRRKVEIWRARRNKAANAAEQAEKEDKGECSTSNGNDKNEKKMWSLEDDEDDDMDDVPSDLKTVDSKEFKEEDKKPVAVEEDEEDPLDAFMSDLRKDLQKDRPVGGVRVVTINAAKEKDKGTVLENEDRSDFVVEDIDMEQAAASLCHKGRMLPVTDHSKVYYRPFRKDFYVETPEIAKMTKAEVRAYREEMDGIEVKGSKCPKPIKTWAQCGVEFKILQQLKKHNYTKPTPIQAQAIPCIMAGRDMIGIAKTGSGKTLAFLLPMFRHILDQPELEELDGPIALIMSPTRELAMQTWKEANKFAKVLDIRVVCVYGGVGISEQIADLKRGAEVIVCTPGRMIDMLAANSGKVTNLRRVTYLVLDEADRMFDMGFEPQVMKIINNIRPDRQTVLFSATFPRQMEALARKILDRPIEILVGGKSVVCADVTQNAVICEEHQKLLKLLELLGIYYEQGNVIVFVDKQEKADDIVSQLMRNGYSCAPLHGGIDQFDRDSTITDFKAGTIKILVATSVAARGLDVKNLILVVNYDCPNHYEDYVHRVGRTGRAGNKGYAYTFVLPEHQERMAGEVCRAFETAGAKPPPELKAMFEKFKEEMAAQGKEVHLGGKGFAGSGYKYDEDEAEADATKKKMTRLVCGMEHGADDDDELDEQLSMMIKSKRRVVEGQLGQNGLKKNADVAKAKAMAEKLAALRNLNAPAEKDAAQKAAEAIMKGGDIAPIEMTSKMIAKQLADKLNEKLNYMGGEALPTTSQEEEWQYFEEELDINDFPQQVRYRVCSRESLGHISEFADVGISVKGSHYPPGKEPKEGDRKLYLLLEARHERNLKCAKEEIVRIMKEAFRQLTAQMQRGGPSGRYKVF